MADHDAGPSRAWRCAPLAICESGDVLPVETCIRRRAGIAAGRAARLPVSDMGSAKAGGLAAALMLATSVLLASAGAPQLGRGALAGVERALGAREDDLWPPCGCPGCREGRRGGELRRVTRSGAGCEPTGGRCALECW